jgi:hypothetical protein
MAGITFCVPPFHYADGAEDLESTLDAADEDYLGGPHDVPDSPAATSAAASALGRIGRLEPTTWVWRVVRPCSCWV